MGWFGDLLSQKSPESNANMSHYPSRTYKKVLCSRTHCTEECTRPRTDPYKFWALFLASNEIKYDDLFLNISSMPQKVRFHVYLKCLGTRSIPEGIAATEEDPNLVKRIFELSGKSLIEEDVFKIYKALDREFKISFNIIYLILELFKMDGSFPDGVYSILYALLDKRGLEYAFRPKTTKTKEKSKSDGNIKEDTNSKKSEIDFSTIISFDQESLNENQSEDKPIQEEKISEPSQNDSSEEELPRSTIYKIWKIIFDEKISVFVQLTDLLICLENATYNEIMKTAAQISLYSEPRKIITVLAAKGNNHFYKKEYKKKLPSASQRKEESYFDFLVIQNELIKAQENIKKELQQRIELLEDYNLKLKTENTELKESLNSIKEQLMKKTE